MVQKFGIYTNQIMAKKFKDIKQGDPLYVVYFDMNEDLQIGVATVTGFCDWKQPIGDMYETWGEVDQRSIEYEFRGLEFSRNLDGVTEKSMFTDSVKHLSKYKDIMSDEFVHTFTSDEEAKDYIIKRLTSEINFKQEYIEKLEQEIEAIKDNLKQYI